MVSALKIGYRTNCHGWKTQEVDKAGSVDSAGTGKSNCMSMLHFCYNFKNRLQISIRFRT